MRFTKIEKPITTTHAELGELSVADAEVPQVDGGIQELVSFHGSEDALVAFCNSQYETNAKNGGRAMLRNAPKDSEKQSLFDKVRTVVRDYSPRGGEVGLGKTKKAAAFDDIKAMVESGKEFTREELMLMLAKAK